MMKTDNGAPFFGKDFADFMNSCGMRHRGITPLWPQANGEVERLMRNMKKLVKSAGVEQRDWKAELNKFLLNYRAAPHSTTGLTPGELLFGRKIRTKLPKVPEKRTHDKLAEIDLKKNSKARRTLIIHRRNAAPHTFQKGDSVLLKRHSRLSHESAYELVPYTVTRVQGTAITAERDGKRILRNAWFFKRIQRSQQHSPTTVYWYDYTLMNTSQGHSMQPSSPPRSSTSTDSSEPPPPNARRNQDR